MKKQVLYRAAAATVLGLSLTTGVAAADTGNYNHHNNHHNGNNSLAVDLSANVSNVGVNNTTTQNAYSGNANATGGSSDDHHHDDYNRHHDNNGGNSGDATTGDVKNVNATSGKVVVNQSSAAPMAGSSNQSSDDHGHDNGGNTKVDLNASLNVSNVEINNQTDQNAYSGNANVSGNKNAGDATTGAATNNNSSSFTVVVKQ